MGTGGAHSPVTAGSCWSPVRTASARHAWWPSSPGVVLRDGGAVRYSSACGAAEASREAAAARAAPEPTLLVLDDVASELDPLDERFAGAVLVVATAEQAVPSLRTAGTLVLKPLNADGVRAFARLYAGETEDVDVPVERLLAASGGLPARLHGVASEWARMLELRRLADSVGRITADRSGLRAAEDDLVGSIVKLQVARERTEPRLRPRTGLSARTRGWLLSGPATRASSSGASGSWPSSSRA